MTEENRAFNPGAYRPRPPGAKPRRGRRPAAASSGKWLRMLLLALLAAALGAWARYLWRDHGWRAQLRERIRPAGRISIQPAA